MSEKVELHPAHTWDCPDCGRENFCRGVTMEMSNEDVQEMIDRFGGEPTDHRSYWITAPESVTCAHCGKEFEAKDQAEDED